MPRWFSGYQTRFLITDLFGVTTTWLDRLTLGAQIAVNLNQPLQGTIDLRSNDPRVNRIFTDGDPLVAQSNRLIYMFFREGGSPPWVCRAAGMLMSPQDEADADVPTTHVAFYDPWQFLFGTPAYLDTSGTLPGPNGFTFFATMGSVIVATLLANAIASQPPTTGGTGGNGYMIDAGPDYGGTEFWAPSGGVIEDTPVIDYNVQQGSSVGDNWNNLLAAGTDPNPGTGPVDAGVDIVLQPIYDPVNRPGYTHNLCVYSLAGTERYGSSMAWGTFTRTSTTADREHDGTPSAFINVANYYAGQGGPPVGLVTNGASVDKYLAYWAQQFFPSQPDALAVQAMAQQALVLAKQGKRTFTLNPDPMRAIQPFIGYNIGDRIPVLAPDALRVEASGLQRVEGIPLVVSPDGITRVTGLLTTPDWRGDDV